MSVPEERLERYVRKKVRQDVAMAFEWNGLLEEELREKGIEAVERKVCACF